MSFTIASALNGTVLYVDAGGIMLSKKVISRGNAGGISGGIPFGITTGVDWTTPTRT